MNSNEISKPFWRRFGFWQGTGTVLVGLIALSSALFTGMQWLDGRNQFLLSTRPHVDFDIEDDPDEPMVGIAVINTGPGPAIVKSITFYVDRKSVQDADEAGHTYAKLSSAELGYQILDPNDTLAVGDKVWLINYRKPRGGKILQKNLEQFSDFVEQHLAIEIVFCSAVQEDLCWPKCSTKDRCK